MARHLRASRAFYAYFALEDLMPTDYLEILEGLDRQQKLTPSQPDPLTRTRGISEKGEKGLLPTLTRESPAGGPSSVDRPGQILTGERLGRRCYACGSDTFWCSVYGPVICSNCHPPASNSLVAGTLWVAETREEWAARLCRKAKC